MGFIHNYNDIISVENLLSAWQEFIKGKKNKKDVQEFQLKLMDNILNLNSELKSKTYAHGGYKAFKINDPKPRDIHKATVRDRVVHHLLYNALYSYFDKKFIYDSYSCRVNKGTHKAIERFELYNRKVSKNHTKQCYILKCDIRKFFASIDHEILKTTLANHIQDKDILNLISKIIDSFHTSNELSLTHSKGLPLGNLTSQLLVNIYMNEFDQYIKHNLHVKYYIRYADDFVILSQDKKYLEKLKIQIQEFLQEKLKLQLHPNKVFITTIYAGIDFLGFVHFEKYRVLRTNTKNRMFKNLKNNNYKPESMASYMGMLRWGNTFKIQNMLYLQNEIQKD